MNKSKQELVADIDIRIGATVAVLRKLRGMTQIDLAKSIHSSQSIISKIENGKRDSKIDLKLLSRISIALGLEKLSKLIQLAEEIPNHKTVLKQAINFVKRAQNQHQ